MSETEISALSHGFKTRLLSELPLLKCIRDHEVQVEGWFKAEFLCLLQECQMDGRVLSFDREVMIGQGRKKVDFKVILPVGTTIWMEIKHWLIGQQKRDFLRPRFYFGDKSSVGLFPDVGKLSSIPDGAKFIMVVVTNNPHGGWAEGVALFNKKFAPICLMPKSDTSEYPEEFFLGVLQVKRN
ncbi:MAG: hypothetical protein ACREJQ_04560 [bacterium]